MTFVIEIEPAWMAPRDHAGADRFEACQCAGTLVAVSETRSKGS